MPQPIAVQGYTGLTRQTRLVLENGAYNPGEQLLLGSAAGAATMSLANQPNVYSPTTGMHLHFYVLGNTSAGSITIAGTNPAGNSFTSITYHVPAAPLNAQGWNEFTTKEAFATVNASGISLTSLTPCTIIVFGCYAGKYLLPAVADSEEKIGHHSPPDKRGILFKNLRVVQTTKSVEVSKLDSDIYSDSLWIPYQLIHQNPGITTVPASPTSLLSSTAIAASMTLSSAPAAPGEFLIFTITSNTASGTITVGGTDPYGNPYPSSETISFTSASSQTVYSSRRYSAVNTGGANKFTTTGGTGASIAVSGVYAWRYSWIYDGVTAANLQPYSSCLEAFTGVFGVVLPGLTLTEGTITYDKEKELAFSSKGEAQDFLIVGDNTSTAGGTNPFAAIAQPNTNPYVSWPATFYVDSDNGGVAYTTQDGTFLTAKITHTTGRKWKYAGDGQQRGAFVTWDSEPDLEIEATLIAPSYQYINTYFKPNVPVLCGLLLQGNLLGATGGTVYYESIAYTVPFVFDTFKTDPSKNPVEFAVKSLSRYDFANLGAAYSIAWIAPVPPTYIN
jgi:hypothetical protein